MGNLCPSLDGDTGRKVELFGGEGPLTKTVMGKYRMGLGSADRLGEGSSSVCRRGTCLETGRVVAIKCYKRRPGHRDSDLEQETTLKKFHRQVKVLLELQQPFGPPPADRALWDVTLAAADPRDLFLVLLDYSRDLRMNEAGKDPRDGLLYVVTEVAQYSLQDLFKIRREQRRPFSASSAAAIAGSCLLVVAALHAKGVVHLDFKPENIMLFGGRLKLIDVDGCVQAGSRVSLSDSTISFSPCYCAPEWAMFVVDPGAASDVVVTPSLDAFSVGLTLCELVTLEPVLKPMYASFLRNNRSNASFLFLEWLGSMRSRPTPKAVREFDSGLADLVDALLVANASKRLTLAQCLRHDYYLRNAAAAATNSTGMEIQQSPRVTEEEDAQQIARQRLEDRSSASSLRHKGVLWKLNADGNPEEPSHWLKRDMWIADNFSLCYFSLKERRRLILLDPHQLHGAIVSRFVGKCCAEREGFAFTVQTKAESDDHAHMDECVFAAEGADDYTRWVTHIVKASSAQVVPTMRLGHDMAQDVRNFKLTVKNRRMKVDRESRFGAVFKSNLWKVKADGNRMREEDWFQREMWIAGNGSLVYWSRKEERELLYYSAEDVANASVEPLEHSEALKPWAFFVLLAQSDGLELAPGEFAAESEAERDRWIQELQAHGATSQADGSALNRRRSLAATSRQGVGAAARPDAPPSPRLELSGDEQSHRRSLVREVRFSR